MQAERDTQGGAVQAQVAALPDPLGGPDPEAHTVLGTGAVPSPFDTAEATGALLEADRLEVGTPLADLGTEQVSPG